MIDIGEGKKVPFKDLKAAAIKNSMSAEEKQKALQLKNEKEKEEKEKEEQESERKNDLEKEHKDGDHKDKEKENCSMCNAIKEFKNSEAGKTHFERVKTLANSRPGDGDTDFVEPYDPIAAGVVAFGSAEPAKK